MTFFLLTILCWIICCYILLYISCYHIEAGVKDKTNVVSTNQFMPTFQ